MLDFAVLGGSLYCLGFGWGLQDFMEAKQEITRRVYAPRHVGMHVLGSSASFSRVVVGLGLGSYDTCEHFCFRSVLFWIL